MTGAHPWPFSADGIEDPAVGFDRWRAEAPLLRLEDEGVWVATGHRAVTALLRDERCHTTPVPTADALAGGDAAVGEPVRRTLARMAVLSDPPEHRDRRLPLQRAFAPEVVEPLRPSVRADAAARLDAAEAGAEAEAETGGEATAARAGAGAGERPPGASIDAVGGLAVPLFDRAMDRALRLPPGAGRNIRRAWRNVSDAVDRPDRVVTPEVASLVVQVHEALAAHLARVRAGALEHERDAPPLDPAPIDVLLGTADAVGLTEPEVVANLILALTSGHRSAAQALALAVRTLARHPGEHARLHADPSLVPHAVEELLRFDGSVQFTSRVVVEDVEIDGCPLAAGDAVMVVLAGANRDPEMFPDRGLDVGAARRPHLGFGRGPHYCPGAPLARLAMAECLTELVARAARLDLVDAPTFTPARRGLDSLLVTW